MLLFNCNHKFEYLKDARTAYHVFCLSRDIIVVKIEADVNFA